MDKARMTRRQFLKGVGTAVGGAAALAALRSLETEPAIASRTLAPMSQQQGNPLESYPNRNWEEVYRNQYSYDGAFTWVCSPNDTHACRLRAFVRNGVVLRSEQNYDYQRYKDLYGNQATASWNPRGCKKGYSFHRRLYGPYRLKYPLMRKGWKQWADDAFPELTPANITKYKFDARGQDELLRVSWDQAFDYLARVMIAIARRYSGEEGRQRLLTQGYPEEMLTWWEGAGTRTMKFRGGMGLLGVIGKYGIYRFSNMMALLDAYVQGVGPDKAKGGRNWSNYTWHGDQAPGFPFVHGLQSSDTDFNDLRSSKLHIQVGKNLVENKMPDSHWFIEMMERGGRVVTIAPEYNPPASKSDYFISVRAGLSDTALFLGLARLLIDNKWYDEPFLKQFTDMPLLIRTDSLKRLQANEVFPGYQPGLKQDGASFGLQGLTQEQYARLGDFVVRDQRTGELKAATRDDVGNNVEKKGIDPQLEWEGQVKLVDGSSVEAMTTFTAYKKHQLKDYDLDTVADITGASKDLVERLARDIGRRFWDPEFVGKPREYYPISVHTGEGVNHYFHATLHNRATYLVLMLVGSIGFPGAGSHTWAGNYKAALFQASPWSGPGFKGWVAEDPFNPNLDPSADGKDIRPVAYARDEEVGYWAHGDRPLIVNTPRDGRKVFTGKSHLPTPTKFIWTTNVNLINNAKWAYETIKNVNPKIECIVFSDIEMTSSVEYCDIALAANSWMEFEDHEVTASCSNPFLQIWKGGIRPLYETKDDTAIMAELAKKLTEITGDQRFTDYWKFALEKKSQVYIQRLLDGSATTRGYKVQDILDGKYGEPGAAIMLFRTYPRIPFYEQVYDSLPFFTPTGRLQAYNDEPEVIRYGENFIVHREGPEATPYLPNAIVSTNPLIRPDNYGFTPEMVARGLDWESRHVANNKLPWSQVKNIANPLWQQGYRFLCVTPKSRHGVHSSWMVTDWDWLWNGSFSDPYRTDKRAPGVGDWQLHISPQAAKDLGINNGDYVYIDADPANRPYRGWKQDEPFYKVSRAMLRVIYNPAYPYNVVMMKHAAFIATERSVKAHETRPDGRALSEGTGYQASFRYGSQQSITISWLMPMHQTDSLFHKKKVEQSFLFGYEADNHAINSVPKETLVKITKAEPGGLNGQGVWQPATTGNAPGDENSFMERYLKGEVVRIVT